MAAEGGVARSCRIAHDLDLDRRWHNRRAKDARDIPPVRFARAADGTSIAYMVWPGAGPPFLLVRSPGAVPMALEAQSGGEVREDILRFVANRPLVEFDWRGNGRSDRTLPTSIDDLLMDLAAITNAIGDVPDVIARAAGSLPAVSFAALNPTAFRSLSLLSDSVRLSVQ